MSDHCEFVMCPHPDYLTTKSYSNVSSDLDTHLPVIFKCQCFNSTGKTFRDEVTDTEMGHLFEHILLEYLCDVKAESGQKKVQHYGRTYWNRPHQEEGTFVIHINATDSDLGHLDTALARTHDLMSRLLRDGKQPS